MFVKYSLYGKKKLQKQGDNEKAEMFSFKASLGAREKLQSKIKCIQIKITLIEPKWILTNEPNCTIYASFFVVKCQTYNCSLDIAIFLS